MLGDAVDVLLPGEVVALTLVAVAVAALSAAVRPIKDDFRVATRGGREELFALAAQLLPPLLPADGLEGAPEGLGGLLLRLGLTALDAPAAAARLPLEELAVPELRRPKRKSMGELELVAGSEAVPRSALATAIGSTLRERQ